MGTPDLSARRARPHLARDAVAGITVAFVLVPQAIAYAGVAGLPPEAGLYAACLPLIAAAFFASSPYLQTGPAAMTSLLTFAALTGMAAIGSPDYIELALLLALIVGVVRLAIGLMRAGVLAHLMSEPMLMGFVPAAGILIILSQLPAALGHPSTDQSVYAKAFSAMTEPLDWSPVALGVAAFTIVILVVGRRRRPLFPTVPLAVAVGLGVTALDPAVPTIGPIPTNLPSLHLDLPLSEIPSLLIPGAVIGLVGFAETAAVARAYANREHMRWDADREFVGQGVANLVAGATGGFPVGGSLSRSSLNHVAGAVTRLSGAITGLAVLAFLPFTALLEDVPTAVPAAVVIAGVFPLLRWRPIMRLWRVSRPQAAVAGATFFLTLALMPHLERAVLAGIGLSILVHLARELALRVDVSVDGDVLDVRPHGVLWFGTANRLEQRMSDELSQHPEVSRVHLDLDGLGRIDVTASMAIDRAIEELTAAGVAVDIDGVPSHASRLLGRDGAGGNGL